jgi:hypothetical protein
MRSKTIFVVSIAFTTCAFVCPGFASAQHSTNGSSVDPSTTQSQARSEAAQMVPAQAVLDKGIDAKKMQPGEQFQATLRQTAQLKNGVELPRDTVLVGTVATDQMRSGGTSKLVLRFTKAELKDGKVVPIQADIMGVAGPAEDASDSNIPGYTLTPWDGKTLRVDEPRAMSGFDFHGSIGGQNSGQFVSTKKDDLKLSAGSQISLAIAAKNA